jgi:hypothetical protein
LTKESNDVRVEFVVEALAHRPHGVGVAGQLGHGHFGHLEAVPEDAEGGARATAACRVNLRRVLVGQIGNLGVEDGREGLQLVDEDEVAQGPRRKEGGVPFFQRHGARELGLVVIVT